MVAGSVLGQIVGSNFPTGSDHNISQRCYRQHHPSLSLYVTDQALHHHTTTVIITGLYIVTGEHYSLLANRKASDSDFIQQIPLCVYKALKAMCHKCAEHNHIYGRPSSGQNYKNFPNKVKIHCSYNSHCGIPNALQ